MGRVTRNAAAPRTVRLSCALKLVQIQSGRRQRYIPRNSILTHEGIHACLLELLVAPAWRESAPTASETQMLAEMLDKMDRSACNSLVLAALQSNALPEWLAVQLARATHHSSDHFEDLVMPILDRWFDPKESSPQVKLALRGAYRLGKQAPRDVLLRALEQPEYVQLAVHSMCMLQAPEFTDVIGEYLTGKRSVDHHNVAAPSPERMLSGLASVGSDAAVGYLLEALSSDSANVQILSAEALDLIEARRSRLMRWEEGLSHGPSRAEALSQLLILLQDESPTARALAVRGVGAFGAVEYIPTLIAMLKDPAQEVREAVVDAVKQLSMTPAQKQVDATLPFEVQRAAAGG